ncbi:hypothetical protein pf16_107 [Pseudomonas phage pf16]|uniref:Prohead core scaffold protein n=1 Tax=Pseudomonas phage pf16 TaxID=1815630 RepID=A0A1S5R633_9CAUD|nr:hypothetical protein FDG98_gp191 [Pseudomonas phage pf16]AND75030.1 hypothetical protein pf16_107 [Pseudomonas phage pf16]
MSEHIKALFEGQELSEEFKAKAGTIFAAALDEQAKQIRESVTAELQEAFETRTQARLEELEKLSETYIQEQVLPQVDKYVAAAIAEWREENKVALVGEAKVGLAESFLSGLVGLAESHNLNLPQGTVDQIGVLEGQIAGLKENLTTLTDKNIELQTENRKFKMSQIIGEATVKLSENQKETFAPVVEKVEYKNDEQFTTAVKSLVESYFPAQVDQTQQTPVNEQVQQPHQKPLNENATYERHLFDALGLNG